jgi:hypothetical protein
VLPALRDAAARGLLAPTAVSVPAAATLFAPLGPGPPPPPPRGDSSRQQQEDEAPRVRRRADLVSWECARGTDGYGASPRVAVRHPWRLLTALGRGQSPGMLARDCLSWPPPLREAATATAGCGPVWPCAHAGRPPPR